MRLAATLVLCLLAGPALAAGCDRWTASMEEDEGGPRMTARICAGAGDPAPDLSVQCGGADELSMRFLPDAPDEGYPPGGDEEFRTELALSLDGKKFTLQAHYEAMDGAMVMGTEIADPLVGALMGGKQLVVAETGGKVPGATFTLAGSREALGKLIRTCTR